MAVTPVENVGVTVTVVVEATLDVGVAIRKKSRAMVTPLLMIVRVCSPSSSEALNSLLSVLSSVFDTSLFANVSAKPVTSYTESKGPFGSPACWTPHNSIMFPRRRDVDEAFMMFQYDAPVNTNSAVSSGVVDRATPEILLPRSQLPVNVIAERFSKAPTHCSDASAA